MPDEPCLIVQASKVGHKFSATVTTLSGAKLAIIAHSDADRFDSFVHETADFYKSNLHFHWNE